MPPPSEDRSAGVKLIESGTLVDFDVLSTAIDEALGGEETLVTIE